MRRVLTPALIATVLVLTGCAASPPAGDDDSQGCRDALEAMSSAPEDVSTDDWNALYKTATTDCATVDEFLAGVHENPTSVWFSDSPIDDDLVITTACLINTETPMCVDAQEQGLLP